MVERWRDDLLAFIDDELDIVFANEAEATALFPGTDFDAAVKALASRVKTAAVTRGAQGSIIVHDGAVHTIPASPIAQVVDTTGAGDQYAAGVLYGLARGHRPRGVRSAGLAGGGRGDRPLRPPAADAAEGPLAVEAGLIGG